MRPEDAVSGVRVGLVLGAGGAVGMAFHAGVLAALQEHGGWDPRGAEVIVGTSAGAFVGALVRGGVAPREMGRRSLGAQAVPEGSEAREPGRSRWVPGMAAPGLVARALVNPFALRPVTAMAAALPAGRQGLGGVTGPVRAVLGDRWPARPLWLPAVSLGDGRRVVFGRDGEPVTDPATAVAASCSVPGVFRPVDVGGVRYVDGGVHSPTNADLVRDLGLDLVVVCSPMSVARGAANARAVLAARGLLARRLARELSPLRRAGVPIVTFQPTAEDLAVMGINALSPRHAAAVRRQAFASAAARLQAGKLPDGAAELLAA